MKLCQVEQGKEVTIVAKNQKGLSVSYKTKVAFEINGMLFVEPVRKKEAILDFSGKGIFLSVTYVAEDGMVLEWKNSAARNVSYQKEIYTVLYAAEDGKKVNRRNTYRQFLAYEGKLQFGKNRKELEVKVRDISVMGIGIIMEEEHDMGELGILNLEYQDEEFNMPIHVYASPVRMEKLDETRTAYGCRIVQSDTNLGRYIAAKQKSEACRVHGTYFDSSKFFHDTNNNKKDKKRPSS